MDTFQKNNNFFNILSEAVSEGIIVVNSKQIIVATNSYANKMFGYNKDELLGKTLNTLIPSKYHHVYGGYFKKIIETGEKRQMEQDRDLYGIKKNGMKFPVEACLNPFEIDGTTYVMSIITDITERREMEKNLTIRSEALKSAINGIVITDALQEDDPIVYHNSAFEKLTGYSGEEILHRNCRFLQGNDADQESIKEMRKAIKEGRSYQGVVRNYKKDGTLFWNEISITPIHDHNGDITHFIGIQNDVTKRKNVEQELIHWSKIFDESLNEIYIFDAHSFRFIDVNQGAQKNMGYTLEEFRLLSPADIKPDYNEQQFQKIIEPLLQGTREKIEFETVHQRKDGTMYPVEVHLQMSTIGNKDVFISMTLDITDRKNYTEKLEKTVEERTEQLRDALIKEKELNELKTKFLSLVSHEFKTPLSSILTSTSLLSKYTLTEQQEKRDKHLSTIKNMVKYLDNILNDFLSVERLESGKVNYRFTTFPLSKLVNEVVYDANMLLKTGQNILYPHNIDDVIIEFDEKILELILSNLVHNAIKYSPENTHIDIDVQYKKDSIAIKIIDQGIGIPEEEQKYVFDRYFRARNALLTQGTGIGLNIVKNHLENLGGSITFMSKENEGSTFIVELPLLPKEDVK